LLLLKLEFRRDCREDYSELTAVFCGRSESGVPSFEMTAASRTVPSIPCACASVDRIDLLDHFRVLHHAADPYRPGGAARPRGSGMPGATTWVLRLISLSASLAPARRVPLLFRISLSSRNGAKLPARTSIE
jgi:hypothetical protein